MKYNKYLYLVGILIAIVRLIRRFNLTVMQTNVLGWLALILIHLSAFVIAMITWWRRR